MNNKNAFQTDRLAAENWTPHIKSSEKRHVLIDALEPILTPPVLQHLPEPLRLENAKGSIDDWINARKLESDIMIIYDRSTSELLGLLILAEFLQSDSPKDIHLGYLFAESAWGKGYATELIAGVIGWYCDQKMPVRLIGGVGTKNIASAKVLQKNGFVRMENAPDDSTEMFCLSI